MSPRGSGDKEADAAREADSVVRVLNPDGHGAATYADLGRNFYTLTQAPEFRDFVLQHLDLNSNGNVPLSEAKLALDPDASGIITAFEVASLITGVPPQACVPLSSGVPGVPVSLLPDDLVDEIHDAMFDPNPGSGQTGEDRLRTLIGTLFDDTDMREIAVHKAALVVEYGLGVCADGSLDAALRAADADATDSLSHSEFVDGVMALYTAGTDASTDGSGLRSAAENFLSSLGAAANPVSAFPVDAPVAAATRQTLAVDSTVSVSDDSPEAVSTSPPTPLPALNHASPAAPAGDAQTMESLTGDATESTIGSTVSDLTQLQNPLLAPNEGELTGDDAADNAKDATGAVQVQADAALESREVPGEHGGIATKTLETGKVSMVDDGDGFVSPAEWVGQLDADADGVLASDEVAAGLGTAFAGLADANKDGVVELEEVGAVVDYDRDHAVSARELGVVLTELQPGMSADRALLLRHKLPGDALPQLIDLNADGTMTFGEAAAVTRSRILADVLDANDDNVVSGAELSARADYNRDLTVSSGEMLRLFTTEPELVGHNVVETLDTDANGVATRSEVRTNYGAVVAAPNAADVMRLLDGNGDGHVPFREAMARIDPNASNIVTPDEVAALVTANTPSPWDVVVQTIGWEEELSGDGDDVTTRALSDLVIGAYDRHDPEKLGQMKLTEAAIVLDRDLRLGPDAQRVHRLLYELDADSDGWVSKAEFLDATMHMYKRGDLAPRLTAELAHTRSTPLSSIRSDHPDPVVSSMSSRVFTRTPPQSSPTTSNLQDSSPSASAIHATDETPTATSTPPVATSTLPPAEGEDAVVEHLVQAAAAQDAPADLDPSPHLPAPVQPITIEIGSLVPPPLAVSLAQSAAPTNGVADTAGWTNDVVNGTVNDDKVMQTAHTRALDADASAETGLKGLAPADTVVVEDWAGAADAPEARAWPEEQIAGEGESAEWAERSGPPTIEYVADFSTGVLTWMPKPMAEASDASFLGGDVPTEHGPELDAIPFDGDVNGDADMDWLCVGVDLASLEPMEWTGSV